MTYSFAHKDYPADTFAAAAAAMLLDGDIWAMDDASREAVARSLDNVGSVAALAGGSFAGGRNGYAVDHWRWDGHVLRVYFR